MDTLECLLRPRLVLNRAQCNRCCAVIISTYRWDYRSCECGYLAVDGGRAYMKRVVNDTEPPFRDFTELSIWTSPYSRRGLIVHAYQPTDTTITCTDAIGRQSTAEPGDYVVYEAEGGSSAWKPAEFHANHTLMEEAQ